MYRELYVYTSRYNFTSLLFVKSLEVTIMNVTFDDKAICFISIQLTSSFQHINKNIVIYSI